MRRKRFKHHLDTIIDILNGYQIVLDYNKFFERGFGEYNFNLLTGDLFFNGEKINPYPIFNFIYHWFKQDLKKHNISKQFIKIANVTVTVISPLPNSLIFKRNSAIVFPTNISVVIITDKVEYKKQSNGNIFN